MRKKIKRRLRAKMVTRKGRKSRKRLPKVISLFSGAGGLDHGFVSAGFEIVAAFDVSEAAIKTHKRNFPDANAVAGDLRRLRPIGVLKTIRSCLAEGSRIGPKAMADYPNTGPFARSREGSPVAGEGSYFRNNCVITMAYCR